ncbi:hypothetical protein MLD38_004966 [Melastoma candidum]|uniref:Uncharacterized protein n=1 Tax=Melastoma candidum TaxID=119954 RepID=A0ACB9SC97_9MYRT|nr:hypothetical protein MLD38_004966 [Melastoma candidum]
MIHAWSSYEKYAWGQDELQPQTRNGVNNFGGLGATLIDSLDTLYIMGLMEQFQEPESEWVANSLDFNKEYDASVFETTIRVVGGLWSAYDLSEDESFSDEGQDIADRLLPAWNTPSGIPYKLLSIWHMGMHRILGGLWVRETVYLQILVLNSLSSLHFLREQGILSTNRRHVLSKTQSHVNAVYCL